MKSAAEYATRFQRAVDYERTGNYILAMEEYLVLTTDADPYRPALVNLGSLYSRMNNPDKAMECYVQAISLEDDYLAWFNIGSLHYKKDEFKQAVIAFEKSKRLNGNFSLAILVMGLSYSRLKKMKAAENCFLSVLKIHPHNEVSLTALAIMYYENGKHHQSIDCIEQLLKMNPKNTGLKKLKSKVLYNLGKIVESAEETLKITKEDKGYTVFNQFIKAVPAEMYTDNYGTLNDKIELLEEKIIEKKPNDMIALSLCYLFKGDNERAIEYLFKAKE